MPIPQEEDDESGRTGPAGTIGGDAAHDCVSENIESNTRRLNKRTNHSVKGTINDQVHEEEKSFEREGQPVSDISNFAVVREKVELDKNNRHVAEFEDAYDQLYA